MFRPRKIFMNCHPEPSAGEAEGVRGICSSPIAQTTNDRFLELCKVSDEASAMKNALQAALQRNRTYTTSHSGQRAKFRAYWASLMRNDAERYRAPVTDEEHRKAISGIQSQLKTDFGHILIGGHPRYGTLRKAFDLYLKFLWRLGKAVTPPRCPIDRNVLRTAGIDASWTECDDEKVYMTWDAAVDKKAEPQSAADWEYDLSLIFLQSAKAKTKCRKP